MLLWAGDGVIECGTSASPEIWRRYLGIVLDGLRADVATPLPHPPLTKAQLNRAGRRPRWSDAPDRQHYNITFALLAIAGVSYALLQSLVAPALPDTEHA